MMEAIRVERKDNAIYFTLYSSSFRFPLFRLVCMNRLMYKRSRTLFASTFFSLFLPLHSFPSLNPHLLKIHSYYYYYRVEDLNAPILRHCDKILNSRFFHGFSLKRTAFKAFSRCETVVARFNTLNWLSRFKIFSSRLSHQKNCKTISW